MERVPQHGEGAPEHLQAPIMVEHLVKRYMRVPRNAVDDVSFNVRRGEIFGLLGPNGAGKTTTIGVLTTYVRPTSGTIQVAGYDVTANAARVKQRIAVVPQRRNLDRKLRARENLTFHAAYHGVPRAIRERRADELLQAFGLDERGKDKADYYSGGMAQRLLIARALMHSPEVLFLDEPTSGLDPQSRLFVWDRLRALHEAGVTILLTTQDLDEADTLCERIAIMDHGHILALNTADELKKLVPGGSMLELHVRLTNGYRGEATESPAATSLLRTLRELPGVIQVDLAKDVAKDANKQEWSGWWQGGGGWGGGQQNWSRWQRQGGRGSKQQERKQSQPQGAADDANKQQAPRTTADNKGQDWSQWQQGKAGGEQQDWSQWQQGKTGGEQQDWSQWQQGKTDGKQQDWSQWQQGKTDGKQQDWSQWQQGDWGKDTQDANEPGLLVYRIYTTDLRPLVGPATQAVLAAGTELRDLHVARPSLENVFIYLTGRALR